MACCKCAILNEALARLLPGMRTGAGVGAQASSKNAEQLCDLPNAFTSLDCLSGFLSCNMQF